MAKPAVLKEALTLSGPAGRLEALLETPRDCDGRAIAVLCHPHPQFQGTMLNKVVHTMGRAANDLRAPALRFNFRGVGASDGDFAQGRGEADDALAVIDWARENYPGAALWLCGFSFGAMVACRAALVARPDWLVSIAPPAERMAGLLEGREPDGRWLVIQGDADAVVHCDSVVSWVDSLSHKPKLVILTGVEHFFHGRLTLLRQTLVEHLGDGGYDDR
jgi:alpha/beta superfamily hydrolase